jgi:hypothetical protein
MAKSTAEQLRELTLYTQALDERNGVLRRDVDRLIVQNDKLRDELAIQRQENAALRQQVQDHITQYQEWDRRRWGLITLLVGAVLSLASGLIVTLARK